MDRFCKNLPKVELHAHINGSISESTMEHLIDRKKRREPDFCVEQWMTCFKKGETRNLAACFKMFKLIHLLSDNVDSVYKITTDVIKEFAADGVKYIEFRTTPREATCMSKRDYIETVLRAVKDCSHDKDLDIIVRLIFAIDRRHDLDDAMNTVQLTAEYQKTSKGIVVGIDLSGDPYIGDARTFIPAFEEARRLGLRLALHLAEVSDKNDETLALLTKYTDRIGHGTFLLPEDGGTEYIYKTVIDNAIPLEVCFTSNVIVNTVKTFAEHHFKFWYEKKHPCIICTDDKGVFATNLSMEYSIAAETFHLNKQQLWDLSYRSIDYIFADDSVKKKLQEKFQKLKPQLFCGDDSWQEG